MKPLNPAHREKRRYLLLSGKDANKKEIEDSIMKFLGILGYAKASPMIIKLEEGKAEKHKGKIVISVNRSELDKIRASFALSGKDLKIEKVSGAIGKL